MTWDRFIVRIQRHGYVEEHHRTAPGDESSPEEWLSLIEWLESLGQDADAVIQKHGYTPLMVRAFFRSLEKPPNPVPPDEHALWS